MLRKEHPETLGSMHNLAFTWKSQGRNKEAVSLMRDCVELQNQILGLKHPDTEASLEDLRRWEDEEDDVQYSN